MSDEVPYWADVRQDLLVQVERLQPEDALRIVKALVAEENPTQLAPALAGLIKAMSIDELTSGRASERRSSGRGLKKALAENGRDLIAPPRRRQGCADTG